MTDDYNDQQPLDEQTIAAGLLAEMQGEIDRLNGERLRALADAENARKRAEKAVQDEKAYGASKFARDLLSVADNLRRAIDTSTAAAKNDPAVANLLTGVELTEKELLAADAQQRAVAVRDAGFTEIAPGSVTVIAEVVDK